VLAADREGEPLADFELGPLFSGLSSFQKILVAVSGGPDSMALLHLLHRWRKARGGSELIAATIDHGLRAEARAEAELAAKFCRTLGVPHRILDWSGDKPAAGIQEAAREARYTLLAAFAKDEQARAIVTAHTRDDQAETFLMRLARGSGLTGLVSIRARSQRDGLPLLRPLLGVPKSRLIATLRQAGIGYAEDSSNKDPRFTRVRLRGLMDTLKKEGIDSTRIALLSQRLARADAALEAAVDEAERELLVTGEGRVTAEAAALFGLPDEISLRLIGRAVGRLGNEGPAELAKLETLHAALKEAREQGESLKRTLAGASLGLDRGNLVIETAPPRSGRLPKS
jgi:tRNA(Ile)-lysidine synthase